MLFYNLIFDTTIYLTLYLFIYNSLIIIIFWTFFNTLILSYKTLNNFALFLVHPFYVFLFTIILLSAAGVPPLLGFFSKLFVLQIILNSKFFLIFILFFFNLLLGLYFYIQNLKYLHSNQFSFNKTQTLISGERNNIYFIYISIIIVLLNLLSFNYIDDMFLLISWFFF
uniref:NADH dehydrogenase subunit 2b n=1 Tax=Strombidium sp. TaxID=181122 RepID=A0A7T0M4J9_9SPIT|nr:NADH dehydrogenase subunit 2b [Strombidium sp.]